MAPLRAIRAGRGGAMEGGEGLLAALEDAHRRFALRATRADLRDRLKTPDSFLALLDDLRQAAARRALIADPPYPLPVICLDQGEEVFASSAPAESERLLHLARAAIDGDAALLLVSIRSDSYGAMQGAAALEGIAQVPLSLGPVPPGEIAHVIREPAEILRRKAGPAAPLFDPAVIERLQREIEGEDDALPLLAFVLQRLMREHEGIPVIGVDELERTGGVAAAIELAAETALDDAGIGRDAARQREALRRLFIPRLARVDRDSKAPQRRVARQSELPADLVPLARALTERRLLVMKLAARREGAADEAAATLEVAHEALLRRWPTLAALLDEDRDALLLLDGVLSAAADWDKAEADRKADFLAHRGSRLSDAQALASRGPDWERELTPARAYLAACQARELLERRQRERLQRRALAATAAGLVVAIVLGGLATFQWFQADRSRAAAEAARVEAESERARATKEADRATREAKDAEDQRSRALLNESRRLEQLAGKALGDRDSMKAALLALEGLPGPLAQERRPYLSALESILYQAGTEMRELPPLAASADIDSKRFVADDGKGHVAIYDYETGERLTAFVGHAAKVTAFSVFKTLLATSSADKTVRIWDIATGRQLAVLQHDAAIAEMSFQSDKLLMTGCADGTARLWGIPDGKERLVVRGHGGPARSLYANDEVHRAISAGDDNTVRLWDTTSGREIAKVTLPSPPPGAKPSDSPRISASLSKSGRFAEIERMIASDVSDALVLDTATGREIRHFDDVNSAGFRGERELVYAYRYRSGQRHFTLWDPNTDRTLVDRDVDWDWGAGQILLWSKASQTLEVWDENKEDRVAIVSAPAPLKEAKFLSRVHRILTASTDGSIAFWNSQTGELVRQAADVGVAGSVYSLRDERRALVLAEPDRLSLWDTQDGSLLVSATRQGWYNETLWRTARFAAKVDGTFRIWEMETGKALPEPDLKADRPANFEVGVPHFSSDSSRAASVISPGKVRIWEVNTGKKIQDIEMPGSEFYISLNRDGSRLMATTGQKVIYVWDADSGALLGRVSDAVDTPSFSPGGNLLMRRETAKDYRTVLRTQLWRMDATSPMTSVPIDSGDLDRARFVGGRERSRILAVRKGSQDSIPRRLQVYRLDDGSRVQEITGPAQDFRAGLIGDHGRHVVTHLADGSARIWDIKTAETLATLAADYGILRHGDRLLVKAKDSRLRMWDIASAKMQYELEGITENATFWIFTDDGRYLATASREGNARLWEAATGRQIAMFPGGTSVFFNHEDDRALVRSKEKLLLVETATGRIIAEFPGWQRFALSRSGPAALVIDKDNGARIIDTTTGQSRTRLSFTDDDISSIQVVDNAGLVLIELKGGAARLFDGRNGREIALPQPRSGSGDNWLCPDGRCVVMEYGNAVFRFEVATGSVVPLQEHKGKIVRTRFSETGRLLVTASDNGDVWLSDVAKGKPGVFLDGSGEQLLTVLMSADERRVVTQSFKGTVRMWDAASGALIGSVRYEAVERPMIDLDATSGMLLVMANRKFASGANVVEVIDDQGARAGELRLADRVAALQLNDDHTRLMAGTADKNVELWDMAQLRRVAQMWGDPADAVRDDYYGRGWHAMYGQGYMVLAFSPDGNRIAAVSNVYAQWSVRLWDRDGQHETTQRFDISDISDLEAGFTPDSRRLWVLIDNYRAAAEVHVFDAQTGQRVATPDIGKRPDDTTIVAPRTGRILLLPSYDAGEARLWDLGTGKQLATIPMLSNYNSIPRFSPDGEWIATAAPDHTIKIWNAATGALRRTLSGHTSSVTAIAFSRDGRLVASGSDDGTARVWELESGKPVHTLAHTAPGDSKPRTDTVDEVAFADHGGMLAARTSRLISLWQLSSAEERATIPLQESSSMSLSPDGHLLLRQGGYRNTRRLIDRLFSRTEDTVAAARKAVARCLTPQERKAAFIDPEPPDWCIEMDKVPYNTEEWKFWLAQRRAGHTPALPLPE
jgi:WD40 repeat protein